MALRDLDTPFYPGDEEHRQESLDELISMLGRYPDVLNEVIGWSWDYPGKPGTWDVEEETFEVYVFMPRKVYYVTWSCPVSVEDEPTVQSLLDRIGDAKTRRWRGERVND